MKDTAFGAVLASICVDGSQMMTLNFIPSGFVLLQYNEKITSGPGFNLLLKSSFCGFLCAFVAFVFAWCDLIFRQLLGNRLIVSLTVASLAIYILQIPMSSADPAYLMPKLNLGNQNKFEILFTALPLIALLTNFFHERPGIKYLTSTPAKGVY